MIESITMKKIILILVSVFCLAALSACGQILNPGGETAVESTPSPTASGEETPSEAPSSEEEETKGPEEASPAESDSEEAEGVTVGKKVISTAAKKANISHINVKKLKIDMDEVLDSLPNLEKIKMIDCGLNNAEYAALQDRHPDVKIVWEVDLTYWKLRTDAVGFTTFNSADQGWGMTNEEAYYLRYCTDLVSLDIGHNFVSDFSFLQYMPNMKVLILADNKNIDPKYDTYYASDYSWLKYCPKLRYVELFINDCSDYSFLQYCKEIEDFNICYSDAADIEYLKDMPKLERLWMEYTFIPYEQYEELTKIYPDATIVYYGAGSVDQGWREGDHYWAMRNMVINNVIDPVYAD